MTIYSPTNQMTSWTKLAAQGHEEHWWQTMITQALWITDMLNYTQMYFQWKLRRISDFYHFFKPCIKILLIQTWTSFLRPFHCQFMYFSTTSSSAPRPWREEEIINFPQIIKLSSSLDLFSFRTIKTWQDYEVFIVCSFNVIHLIYWFLAFRKKCVFFCSLISS